MDRSQLLSIGQTARLFSLSVGTLRHYEALGLVMPEYTDPDTGYRYYSVRQFEPLNTIRYLRMLGMPLPEIADFLQNRDISRIEDKLRQQKAVIEEKQRELEIISRKIDNRLRQLEDAHSSPLGEITVKTLPACRLVWVERPLSIGSSLDVEMPIRALEAQQTETAVFLGKVGVGISREGLLSGRFEHYDCIFLVLDDEDRYDGAVRHMPASECVSIRYCGSHTEAPEIYCRLREYMRQNGLTPSDFSREITMIDYGVTDDPNQFVTEISIPI